MLRASMLHCVVLTADVELAITEQCVSHFKAEIIHLGKALSGRVRRERML